jgi:hypothetical protein
MEEAGGPASAETGQVSKTGPLRFAGPVRLINGEDSAAYDTLLARFTDTLKPVDVVEEAWVRDVVDLVWEALRLRRLKASLLAGCAYQGLQRVLITLGGDNVLEFSQSWAARNPETVASADDVLASAGWSMDTVMARTFTENIDSIDRMERMTMAAEARRNAALGQIEHYRESFGKRLRGAVDAIEAEEIKAIPPSNAPAVGQV